MMTTPHKAITAQEMIEWLELIEASTQSGELQWKMQTIRYFIKAHSEPQDNRELWLWKNGDHYLAYDNKFPCKSGNGDPLTLGEPSAKAYLRQSVVRGAHSEQPAFLEKQEPLGKDFEKVLYDNLDKLVIRDVGEQPNKPAEFAVIR